MDARLAGAEQTVADEGGVLHNWLVVVPQDEDGEPAAHTGTRASLTAAALSIVDARGPDEEEELSLIHI